jgi:hypothetical protein
MAWQIDFVVVEWVYRFLIIFVDLMLYKWITNDKKDLDKFLLFFGFCILSIQLKSFVRMNFIF